MVQKLPEYVSPSVEDAERFFLNLAPDPCEAMVVSWGGRERCRPDYLVDRPELKLMTIEFVAMGTGHLRLHDSDYRLRCGTAFFYGPGIPHRIQSDAASPMVKFFVNFVGSEAERLIDASPLRDGGPCEVSTPGEITHLFDQMIHESKLGSAELSSEICAVYLRLLILKITERAIPVHKNVSMALESFRRSKAYIQRHYLTLTRINEIAEAVSVSESYLCRLFKRFEGVTPYAYLMQLRLNHAAQMLTTTSLSVAQVARELGFTDQFQFSRNFKSKFGIPPIRFRSTHSRPVMKQ